MNHLGCQLSLSPLLFAEAETPKKDALWDQEKRLRDHCGFRLFSPKIASELETQIQELSTDGKDEQDLSEKAYEFLFDRKIIPPAASTMERLITSALSRTQKSIYGEIYSRVPTSLRKSIDQMLSAKGSGSVSELTRFKEFPPEASAEAIIDYLDRYEELTRLGVSEIDLTEIKGDIVFQFYQLVNAYDVWMLRRFSDSKRYALVACFLSETLKIVLDNIVDMNDQYITGMCRKSRNTFERKHRELRIRSRQGLDTVLSTVDGLLELKDNPELRIIDWYSSINATKLNRAMADCRTFQRLDERGYWDEIKARYPNLRRYLPKFFNLPFKAEPGGKRILEAIEMLRQLNLDPKLSAISKMLSDQFLSENLRKTLEQDGEVLRGYWEAAIAIQVRDALRGGQLHLPESKRNVSFWNLIYDSKKWSAESKEAYVELSLPNEPQSAVEKLTEQFNAAASDFTSGLNENSFVKIQPERFKLTRGDALEIPERVKQLKRVIDARLPKVRIEEVLAAVNRSTDFLKELRPLPGYEPREKETLARVLPAALIAHGTNLGIAAMGSSAKGISVDQLGHVSKWYLRESTIKAANRAVVDYHNRLPISSVWGDGTLSSSDGQRFGVQKSSLLASFYPRYFGYYERAVTVYTHTSDQHSVFGTEVISCGVREALYVLDGLLENNTELNPQIHFTDTHGYTEHLFGLCYLLRFSFRPRIRDLSDQKLYKIDSGHGHEKIESVFSGRVDVSIILEQWDALVRIASSLKNKTAPAHLIVGRLARAHPQDRLAKALTALGRIVKTTYVLRYLHDEKIRRQVQLQLNRGEARHQLGKHLFFANQGQFRSGDYEEMMNKASCLSLLSNIVLVANTKAITKLVKELRAQGEVIEDADLAKVSPLTFQRVIPNGTYHFK